MTANRRILLNIVATYGRSLYALVIGLFCGRWTLMSLGQVDYGLFGLIGGLTGFISFFNGILASAVGRFYAVSVGAAHKEGNAEAGLEECRKWFNTALSVHSVLPIILIIAGYPLGVWAIENFLTIPVDRIPACIWVWRFTCVSCFIGMANVPFQAMYTAKQEIAELTLYSFVTTTLNALFLYYMITHPAEWIVRFSAWVCLLSVVPQTIIAVRAVMKYPECRFRMAFLWDRSRFRGLCKFAYASFMPNLAGMLSGQAKSILVNKYMGPQYNASMAIGGSVTGHTTTLVGAVSGAMWPAVANKAGEGDEAGARKLIFLMCRLGAVMVLIFAIPLSLEVHEVLKLWLVQPPPFTAEICIAILIDIVFSKLTDGYWMAFSGFGRGFVQYCNTICLCGFVMVLIAWIFFVMGFGMWSICFGVVSSGLLSVVIRLYCGKRYMNYSVMYWVKSVFLPVCLATLVAFLGGIVFRMTMSASFLRVAITTITSEIIFIPSIWFFLLQDEERSYILKSIRSKLARYHK